MRRSRLLPAFLLAAILPLAAQTAPDEADAARTLRHQSSEWLLLEPHLPSLTTGSVDALQTEGDILRARRYEEDALEFYAAALRQGGDQATLINRIGVTQLVLRHPELARACFRRVLTLRPGDAQGWNNLGASEYFSGNQHAALTDYLRAVRLRPDNALFHSNLGTTYFELKDYESAARQFQAAFRLDPAIFDHVSTGGLEARLLSATERGRFCFELARIAALQHQDATVMEWLRKAVDAGCDIEAEMKQTRAFNAYEHDPRVHLLIANARAMRPGRLATNTPTPSLAEIATQN